MYEFCPICNNKFQTIGDQSRCVSYPGHIVTYNFKLSNKKIEDLVSVKICYLPFNYTVTINYVEKFTEICLHDYGNNSTSKRIYSYLKDKKILKINKIITPDYPDLNNFKENINKYIIFI